MTLGEKLVKLRKENNYTQEQFAEILGISRQSVSKWESDLAYPETDKLIEIGRIYNCSMDYLLKDEITEKSITMDNKSDNKLLGIWKSICRGINRISISNVINVTIKIAGIIIAIDVIAAIIYSIICGLNI